MPSPARSPEKSNLEFETLITMGAIVGLFILSILRRKNMEMQKERGEREDGHPTLIQEVQEGVHEELIDEICNEEVEVYGSSASEGDISDDEIVSSAFAKGSNTAKLLAKRQNSSGAYKGRY